MASFSQRSTAARSASALSALMAIAFLAVSPGATAQKPEKSVLSKPQPKFEPRPKFDEGSPGATAESAPLTPGAPLDHGFVGPRGTIYVCGMEGDASFLWPTDGKNPKFYRESMVYAGAEADGLVFRLTGRFYRVLFKVGLKPDASGGYPVWVRNGDRDWALYQSAAVAPRAM
jgi:hypothetical protein